MTAVLIGAEHAARHLAVDAAYEVEVVVCVSQCTLLARQQGEGGRFAEALRHIHVVPVGQRGVLHPVGRAAVYLPHELEQKLLPGAVVEPDDAEQIVASTAVLPVVTQELLVGIGQFPSAVGGHHGQHALVGRVLVVVLQDLQSQHVGPQLAPAVLVGIHWTEIAVGLGAAQYGIYPEVRLSELGLISQLASQGMIATQPIGHFFPSVRTALLEPGIAFLVEPVTYLAQPACQSFRLTAQHLAHPSAGFHTAQRELDEDVGAQWCTVVHVECACGRHVLWPHHLRFLRL